MTVRELRDRLPWDNEDAEIEVITEKVYDLHYGGFALKSIVAVTIDNPEEKVTRVVLLAE